MTTSIFPADKSKPFVAENGVTYVWEADRWRVKQYKLDDAALEDYATEIWVEEKIAEAELDGDIDLSAYATRTYSDSEDSKLQLQIEELSVTKGKVARYIVDNVSGTPVSRAGQLSTNNPFWSNVVVVSFGTEDADNVLTKPMNDDDIIEFVDPANGKVSRYKITDASGAPTLVAVEFISGNCDFALGAERQVFIYPQNASSASKEYVDAQDNALKDYVDEGLAGKLNNAGANDLSDGTDWKVRQQNASGSNKTLLQIKAGELGVYNLKEPTQSHHAATKAYVDAKPSGGSGFGISASRPPGLKFFLSIVNLPDGYFQWWTNNSTNNQHLEIATTDRDGIAWGTNTLREDVKYNDKIPFTIWEVADGAWKMKVNGTISRIDFHPDHALCYVSSKTALNGGDFVNGAGPYYITISGLF
ncbi:MAG: hypothetical protein CMA72_09875 [Euryarchaeota archaeon]|nr:hypothetical protein [Euryarchaeota archaeon]